MARSMIRRRLSSLLTALLLLSLLVPLSTPLQPGDVAAQRGGGPPTDAIYACVSLFTGQLRYSPDGACTPGRESRINLNGDPSITVCVSTFTNVLRYPGANGSCTSNETPLVLPGEEATPLCVGRFTNLLRYFGDAPCPNGDSTVTVPQANDPPIAQDDAFTIDEDSPLAANVLEDNGNGVDSDPDGDPLTVNTTPVSGPSDGALTLNDDGNFTYTPDQDFNGVDTFVYELLDDKGGSDTATVTITINPVNDDPVAQDDAITTNEDTPITFDPRLDHGNGPDSDVDGDDLDVTGVGGASNGTTSLDPLTDLVTYTPDANYHGPDSFTYTVSDGNGGTDTGTVNVTVAPVNDAPVADDTSTTTVEDTPITVTLTGSDIDGDSLTFAIATGPVNGSLGPITPIDATSAQVTYTPDLDYNGPDSFTFTVNDGTTDSAPATVSITVAAVDDPPVANDDTATVSEDSSATTIDVLANDPDVDDGPISIQSVTQPANGTVVITNGGADLTYQPAPDYCNDPPGDDPDTFTYTLNGGSTATVSVTVTCDNDAPVIDLDADDSQGTGGSDFATTYTENAGGLLIVDPTDATITDIDSTTLVSITVTITNLVDVGLEFLEADASAFPDITTSYNSTTGVLTISSASPQPIADYVAVLRTVAYEHSGDNPTGPPARVIEFVANDGDADSNTATSTVTIVPVDDPPVAVNDAATVLEDSSATTIDVLANDSDVDDGPISIQSVTQPANGTVAITGGGTGVSYTPNANYCNDGSPLDTFTYTLNGGSTATVSVTVTCVNDAPTANDDTFTTDEDVTLNTDATNQSVLDNDTDPENDTLTVTEVNGDPANVNVPLSLTNGTLTVEADGSFTYVPDPDANGLPADTFTYTVCDPEPLCDTATVTLNVTPVNDPPVANDDSATTDEDTADSGNLLGNDTDVDTGDTMTVDQVDGDAGNVGVDLLTGDAVLTIAANGDWSFSPNGAYDHLQVGEQEVVSVTYQIVDSGGLTDTATFTLTITGVNDAPTAVADSYDGAIGNTTAALQFTVTGEPHVVLSGSVVRANDTDPDNDIATATVALESASAGADVTVNNDGSFTYLSAPGFTGTDSFTYRITDEDGASAIGTVNISVTNTVWYIDPDANSGGDGRSNAPFDAIGPVTTGGSSDALDDADDFIFIYDRSVIFGEGIVLETNQQLIGEPHGLTVNNGITDVQLVPAGGLNPIISGTGITLAEGVNIQRVNVQGSNGAGITGTNVNNATVGSNITLTNSTGADFQLSGGNGTISVGAAISNNVGRSVDIQGRTGGSVTLSGAINDTGGTGILLNSNTGGTITFTGGVTLSTGGNPAFTATGGGTVVVTGTGNTLATTTATALNVTNTTIGGSGLNFQSIDSNGAVNGIVLNNTGTTAGLTVTGTGSAGSGGTIQSSTGVGILLTSTANVSLGYMNVQSSGDDGIRGTSVANLILSNCNLTSNGNAVAENGLQLGEASGSVVGITGTLVLTNTNITGSAGNNVHIRNTSGTLSSMSITGGSFNNISDTTGANSFLFEMSGTAVTTTATIDGATFSNNSPQRALEVQTHDNGTISSFTVTNSTFNDNGMHTSFTQDTTSNLTFTISNNSMLNANPLQAINVFSSSTSTGGTITGTIQGNTIGNAAVAGSGSTQGQGIRVLIQGQTSSTLLIDGNTIRQVGVDGGARGIDLQFLGSTTTGLGNVSTNDVTVTNNFVQTDSPNSEFPLAAIYVAADNQGSPTTVRADISGNTVPTTGTWDYPTFDGTGAQLVYVELNGATAQLVGNSADATTQLANTNTGTVYTEGVALIPGPINVPS